MSGKRKVNRSHPDFPEYKRKFDELWDEMEQETQKAVETMGEISGMDGPHVAVHKKYSGRITVLQKQYAYLFVEEVGFI